jgi:homoserine O-acetyltransferase
MSWLVGPQGVLDPTRWCIIAVGMFSNGESSGAAETPDYPALVTVADNVRAQHRLVTEMFGVDKLAAVYGFSMGGMQAYHWAAVHPDMVERAAVVCGSARCAPYNCVFLQGVKAALTGDPAFRDGRFVEKPVAGYRAMGRVYAGWAMSHAFYRDEVWREAGFTSLEDYLARAWDATFARRDANDLLAQVGIWQRGDISRCAAFGGDLDRALAAVKAHMLLMPGATDRYFDVRDNEDELGKLINAKSAVLHPIPSLHGHRAGNPVNNPRDFAFLKAEIAALLSK